MKYCVEFYKSTCSQVLCNLAGQYAMNEMYTEALNTYQLLTRNKLFPHANRLKASKIFSIVILTCQI